jgi:heat shock protein 5
MKNSIEDPEKLADKLSEGDKETIKEAIDDALSFVSSNPDADTEEYQDKLKEVEQICNPIVSKVYQNAGEAGGDFEAHDDL